MSIIGIEKLYFGVEDLARSREFITHFGLKPDRIQQDTFITKNGAQIAIKHLNDVTLPPAFESGSTLREVVWGVKDQAALAAIGAKIQSLPSSHVSGEGITCVDPNGMTHRFVISALKPVEMQTTPMNQWGNYQRVDEPSPVYDHAEPVSIGHVVFFCEDLGAVEAFFVDTLGFHVSDRYLDRGVFLRAQAKSGHHTVFILKLPNRSRGLNHVAFTVRDIHEVFGGGIAMEKHQWATFIGPGRHPISSAYFWYIKSPLGGAFEYYSNEDSLTEKWQPRELMHTTEHFTEWAIEGGINPETRRQYKEGE